MLKHAREINSRRFIHDFAWLSIEKIVLEKFWEKITDTCAFFMVVWCQTHYQTLSTRKNWLLCIQNTLLAFCHTGPTKRIEKKSGRIEKAGRIKIYTGTGCDSQITTPPTFHPHPTYIWYGDQTWFLSFSGSHKFFYRRNKHMKRIIKLITKGSKI